MNPSHINWQLIFRQYQELNKTIDILEREVLTLIGDGNLPVGYTTRSIVLDNDMEEQISQAIQSIKTSLSEKGTTIEEDTLLSVQETIGQIMSALNL